MYPTLDSIVLGTIDLYETKKNLPILDLTRFQTPLVVGSGNGFYTGRIIFRHLGAFYATESEIDEKLKNIPSITNVVVISASGEKHAPIILRTAKEYGKHTFLISSNEHSTGRTIADESIIMPRIREPYTYNTSTYFGYIFAGEQYLNLWDLRDFITGTLDTALADIDFARYTSFLIVIPDQFVLLREMIEIKFIELFWRRVARDIFSYEQMRHATTVVEAEGELCICFGNDSNRQYSTHQVNLPLFTENSQKQEVRSVSESSTSYAAMMLVSYYTVGRIQAAFPPYFMDSIAEYCKKAKVQSGFDITPWVEV